MTRIFKMHQLQTTSFAFKAFTQWLTQTDFHLTIFLSTVNLTHPKGKVLPIHWYEIYHILIGQVRSHRIDLLLFWVQSK